MQAIAMWCVLAMWLTLPQNKLFATSKAKPGLSISTLAMGIRIEDDSDSSLVVDADCSNNTDLSNPIVLTL